jgi:hypothetical protein
MRTQERNISDFRLRAVPILHLLSLLRGRKEGHCRLHVTRFALLLSTIGPSIAFGERMAPA